MTFDPTTTGLSQANAYACAVQSALAYDPPPRYADNLARPIRLESDLAHVTITETIQAVFVAFRGTKNVRDFVTDAECLRQRSAVFGGAIHAGFLKSFLSISDALTDQLFKLPAKPIFITGHSLGGALAELCAVWCFKRNIPVRAVYTFGQPRVGDHSWSIAYQPLAYRTFRLVLEEDIVPRVPGWLAGYRHAGQLALLPSFGDEIWLNPSPARMLLSDCYGIYRAFMAKRSPLEAFTPFLNDHHIDKYIGRLSPQ